MPEDYEEKYLALRDENTTLKKKKNEQEATIKRYKCVLAHVCWLQRCYTGRSRHQYLHYTTD